MLVGSLEAYLGERIQTVSGVCTSSQYGGHSTTILWSAAGQGPPGLLDSRALDLTSGSRMDTVTRTAASDLTPNIW